MKEGTSAIPTSPLDGESLIGGGGGGSDMDEVGCLSVYHGKGPAAILPHSPHLHTPSQDITNPITHTHTN